MYGLLLESLHTYIVDVYGEDAWLSVTAELELALPSFDTHEVYPDALIPRLTSAGAAQLGMPTEQLVEQVGRYFVLTLEHYGYTALMKVMGRTFLDFLNCLDDLHDYLKFSYNKLKSPMFAVVAESRSGVTLQYRTKRKGLGLEFYIMGILRELASRLYTTDLRVSVVTQTEDEYFLTVVFRLEFDNSAYTKSRSLSSESSNDSEYSLPVTAEAFNDAFPFYLLLDRALVVQSAGATLLEIAPDIAGRPLVDVAQLCKPFIKVTWDQIMLHKNNKFEIKIYRDGDRTNSLSSTQSDLKETSDERKSNKHCAERIAKEERPGASNVLRLRGMMRYLEEEDLLLFVGSPDLPDLRALSASGLYLNELCMHDCSRELVLAGSQKSDELKSAIFREHEKSKSLWRIAHEVKSEIHKTETLLYQMLPRPVARLMRSGSCNAMDTCKTFECATVLMSDVVGFTSICNNLSTMKVVSLLNAMYSAFDALTERHHVFKVETIGDAYVLAGGVPMGTRSHAFRVVLCGLDMIADTSRIPDPSRQHDSIRIRVGVHSGPIIAGVVGLKMPRYCLFGSTVQMTKKMEETSPPQSVHLSAAVKSELESFCPGAFEYERANQLMTKDGGSLETFVVTQVTASPETLSRLRDEIDNEMRQLEAALGVEEAEHSSLASVQSRGVSPSAESSNMNTSTSPEPPRTISSCSQHSIEDSRVLNDIMREQREKAEKEKKKEKEKEREEQEAAEIQRESRQETLKEEPDLMKVVENGVVNGPEAEKPASKACEKRERHKSRCKGKKDEAMPPQISVTTASGEAPTLQLPDGNGSGSGRNGSTGCSEGGDCANIVDRSVSRIMNYKETSPASSPRRGRMLANGNVRGVSLALPSNGSLSPRRGDGMERSLSHPRDSDRSLPALAAYELHSSAPDLHASAASSSVAINQNHSGLSTQRQISIPNDQSAAQSGAHKNCPQPQNAHTNGDSQLRSPAREPPLPAKLRTLSPVKISVNSKISISSPTKLSYATRVIMVRPTEIGAKIPDANNNSNSQLFPCAEAGRESERETLAAEAEAVMKLNGMRGGCAQCARENPSFEEGPEELTLETVVPRGSVTLLTQSPPSRGEAIARSVSQESFDSCATGHHCRNKFCALI